MNKDINKIIEEAEEIASDLDGGWWNYRIIEIVEKWEGIDLKMHKESIYELHEVYYNGKGDIIAWTERPMSLYFYNHKDYKDIMKHIKKATKRSILKLEDDNLIDTHKFLKFRR